ncbi:hypothetical protein TWF481_009148 [Arthrobotrys musiformis]|uniref:Uncharacterized protein n=1 Tax=Arthrobotrys musiformis TaxID=47236 RepID=A0AAV9W2Q8_9PEZI
MSTIRPLPYGRNIRPGKEAALTTLLLNTSVLNDRLIRSGVIVTKGGKRLPPELWYIVLDEYKLRDRHTDHWVLLICDKIWIKLQRCGCQTAVLRCCQARLKDGKKFGSFSYPAGVKQKQRWLNEPLASEAWVLDGMKRYNIEFDKISASGEAFVYHRPSVADIIAKIENGQCEDCEGRRSICGGCYGFETSCDGGNDHFLVQLFYDSPSEKGIINDSGAQRLVCPLCIGVDKVQENAIWDTGFGVPVQDNRDQLAMRRALRWNDWLQRLGYTPIFQIPKSNSHEVSNGGEEQEVGDGGKEGRMLVDLGKGW